MNLAEFKAWFEGFTENLDGAPTERQWVRIREKVGQIKDAPPVTYHHFHDYYYRPWRRWYGDIGVYSVTAVGAQNSVQGSLTVEGVKRIRNRPVAMMSSSSNTRVSGAQAEALVRSHMAPEPFDSSVAFAELGRAEFRSMAGKTE